LLTTIALAVAVAAAAAALAAPEAHATTQGHFGPRNPAFLAWLHDRSAGPLVSTTVNGHSLAPLVPVPVDPASWSARAVRRGPLALGDTPLPASYDPRLQADDPSFYDLLPAIRDQGQDNDCWAYSSIASLEWSLLPATTMYGEYDLAYKAAADFDWGLQDGGNYEIATAELARWRAPVSESAGVDSGYTPGLPTIEHVKDVLFLPDRTSASDNDTIKAAIQQYGAVYTAMYADDGMSYDTTSAYFNKSTSAYYYNGSAQPDHAVDIVGWDDSYSRANFSTDPGMDGAFICRNSWSSAWGDGGYFYVSYADVLIGTSMAVFTGEPTTDYAQNLGHDTLGFTDSYGFGTDTAWMAAGYTVKGDSTLEAAGLYALSPGTTYTLYAGTSLTNHATWTNVGSGTLDVAGYHTVAFTTPYNALAGVKFYVIAQVTAPTTVYPLALEDYQSGYSSRAASAAGQSYVSSDGTTWGDLTVVYSPSADVCLKVFAGAATPDQYKPVTKALAAASVYRGHTVSLRYRVNDATGKYDVEKVVIRIRTKAGKLVKTITVGTKQPNVSLSYRYLCKLPRGSYRWYVYATDRWGNTQSSVGRASLTVK
jgi:C1A family cysteine protease